MARQEYYEKLKDPRWQKKRLEVLQRDEFMCRKCYDDKSTLNVHHTYYQKGFEPWEYPLSSLITLCESCHEEERESQYEVETELIQSVRSLGFLNSDIHDLARAFQGPAHLLHANDVICDILQWILSTDSLQRELIDRHFADIKERFGKKVNDK